MRGAIHIRGPLVAPSVTAWAHTAFPELGADRPYHQPGDDSRRDPKLPSAVRDLNGSEG